MCASCVCLVCTWAGYSVGCAIDDDYASGRRLLRRAEDIVLGRRLPGGAGEMLVRLVEAQAGSKGETGAAARRSGACEGDRPSKRLSG